MDALSGAARLNCEFLRRDGLPAAIVTDDPDE